MAGGQSLWLHPRKRLGVGRQRRGAAEEAALLPGIMDKEMRKRAVYFFNAKQVYLWLAGGQGLIGKATTYVS